MSLAVFEKAFNFVVVILASVIAAMWLMSFAPDVFVPVVVQAMGLLVMCAVMLAFVVAGILADAFCFIRYCLRKIRKA